MDPSPSYTQTSGLGGDGVAENTMLLLSQVLCAHPCQFGLDNGMIEAHTVEFDLDIGSLSEVVAAVRDKHLNSLFVMSDMPAQRVYKGVNVGA
jgi:hypothetical protein